MSRSIKVLLGICLPFLLCVSSAFADKVEINHFAVRENPFGSNEIAIVATDTAGVVQEGINGDFLFTLNGFQKTLKFENGVALDTDKLAKSSFIYVRHQNEGGVHSALFYVYKGSTKLTPIHINWIWLIAIPAIIILLGYMFKRFIIIAGVLLLIFIYFNHSSGLGIGTFFESVLDGLRHMF